MSSNKLLPPLPDVVPERESLIVRHCAEHLEGLGLSDRATSSMSGTASHFTAWLVASGLDLGTFDIRLVDRFMRPERPRCDR